MTKPALMPPSRAADYVARMEHKLGRKVARAALLPGGGIEITMQDGSSPDINPADLVDMDDEG